MIPNAPPAPAAPQAPAAPAAPTAPDTTQVAPIPMGAPQLPMMAPPGKYHDVTIRRTKLTARCVVSPVPPEEFGITRFARNIKDCGYCFHEVIRRESDMVADGYDPEQVRNLNTYSAMTNQEELARDTVEERQGTTGDGGLNRANREIKVTEHYIILDYEQNNNPGLYRITTAGDPSQILRRRDPKTKKYSDEIVRWQGPPPFAIITPVPMPHRFFGRSVADIVMDIQRIKTVILRGGLDNIYQRINPSLEISETHAGPTTFDDVLTSRPNRIVRTRAPGGLNWQEVPDISPTLFPFLQYMDAQREWRSGVSRQGQGVDGNSLQNQVATIANQMLDASQAKVKLIARIFAETGIKDLFWLIHHTLRKHGGKQETIRLRGNWVSVDPRAWKAREDLTINVGLGNGDKAHQLMSLQLLANLQEKIVVHGGQIVSPRNVFNMTREMTKLTRPGADVQTFFTDPGAQPDPNDPASKPYAPKPDPKQADAQVQIQKAQIDMQIAQQKGQNDIALEQARMALEDKQAAADIEAQRQAALSEQALQQQKFALEERLAMRKAELEERSHQQELRHAEEMHHAKILQTAQDVEPERVDALTKKIVGMSEERTRAMQEHHVKREDGLKETMVELTKALKSFNAPKRVIRGKDGKVTGVEPIH